MTIVLYKSFTFSVVYNSCCVLSTVTDHSFTITSSFHFVLLTDSGKRLVA